MPVLNMFINQRMSLFERVHKLKNEVVFVGIYEDHKKIHDYLAKAKECYTADEIADALKMDRNVVIDHLKIAEIDQFGTWTSENGEFCSWNVIKTLEERLK